MRAWTTTSSRFRMLASVLVAIVLTVVIGLQATALTAPAEPRVIVTFDTAKSEEFISTFIARNGLSVEAVYLASNGFSGAHRAYRGLSAQGLLASVRSLTVKNFTQALDGNTLRIRRFVDMYSEADLITNSDLTTQARSLLNVRSQIEAVLRAARTGQDLIYAIEARSLDSEKVDSLARESSVHQVHASDGTGAGRSKPRALEIEYHDPLVESRGPRETRVAMVLALDASEKGVAR